MSEEPVEILVQMAERGEIDPWNIDIVEVTDRFLSELERLLESKKDILTHTPSVWPAQGWVTSGFGFRTNPFTGLSQMHEALDISNRTGTLIVAPADGIVSDIGRDSAYGVILVISHGFGMTTRFAHLNKTLVKVGQKVKRGDIVGYVGSTGKSTGPHVHYEIWAKGKSVNPKKYLQGRS